MTASRRGDGSIAFSLDADDWRTERRRRQWLKPFSHQVVQHILAEATPHDDRDYIAANRIICERTTALRASHVDVAYDESSLRRRASRAARDCRTLRSLDGRIDYARTQQVSPPPVKPGREEGVFHRLGCERWWRRALRRAYSRRSEDALREIGLVHRATAPYVSDLALRHHRARAYGSDEFLRHHALQNELTEQLPLLEVAERSVANPALRRAELMVRIRGFEEIAASRGDAALFATLTCPSAYHARLMTSVKNPRYRGFSIEQGQAWLREHWAQARAKLKRLSIRIYGFRVAEPHHDGTPHWHLLLFCRQAELALLQTVLRGYWMQDYGHEAGAEEFRCNFKRIEASAGTAAGYIAKYVAKNIDGAGTVDSEGDEESGLATAQAAERVRAWASLHGIRQFQQLGGPPVGLYREFRRLRDPVVDPDLERARKAADLGSFGNFIQATGGITVGCKTSQVIERELTGELSAYFELRAAVPIGVRCASAFERTRHHTWRMIPCWSQASSATASASLPSSAASRLGSGSSVGIPTRIRRMDRNRNRLDRNTVSKMKQSQGIDSSQDSASFSALGPVGITVRTCVSIQVEEQDQAWKQTLAVLARGKELSHPCINPHQNGDRPAAVAPVAEKSFRPVDANAPPEEFARAWALVQALTRH